jgi:hypothetical protein
MKLLINWRRINKVIFGSEEQKLDIIEKKAKIRKQ